MNESIRKLSIVGLVCVGLLSVCGDVRAETDLTQGHWLISGIAADNSIWDGSTLHFESQSPSGMGFDLTGYFLWMDNFGRGGRENFNATLSPTDHLELVGFELVPPFNGIALATYSAELNPAGNALTDGTWDGTGAIPGTWSAVLVEVPEPGSLIVTGAGLALLACSPRGRRKV